MQGNPEKFQVLAVGKKTFGKQQSVNINSANLSCKNTMKLLGIEIVYKLNFDIHIGNLCRKASQQLNILKRLNPFLNRLTRLNIFHTFIFSNFNICPLV